VVVMRLPNGTTCECLLRNTKYGLRLVRPCASYDLLALVREGGWRVEAVETDLERKRLARAFGRSRVAA
jgi:hypothetical protein